MVYRGWSLLSSMVAIWGGAAAAGLAGLSVFDDKKFQSYLCREGERLRQQDKAMMASANGPYGSAML